MTPNQEGDLDPRSVRPSPWRLLAAPALAALFAFGVALALPSAPAAAPPALASRACVDDEVELPPGHPPIGGRAMMPRGHEALLPPGHPPIGARSLRAAPPLRPPTFSPPEILDI
jgi:hypothetical protein